MKTDKNLEKVVVRFANFSFTYEGDLQGQPAISNITFPIVAKQITAIIGSSGCGKTTLL